MAKVATKRVLLALTVLALLFSGVFALTACGKEYKDPKNLAVVPSEAHVTVGTETFANAKDAVSVKWDKKNNKYVVSGTWSTYSEAQKGQFSSNPKDCREGYVVLAFAVDKDATLTIDGKEVAEYDVPAVEGQRTTKTVFVVCAVGKKDGETKARAELTYKVTTGTGKDAKTKTYKVSFSGLKAPKAEA